MESKAKKRLFNGIMVLLILVILGSGIVTVGMVQGWLGPKDKGMAVSGNVRGIVNIERKGIGYALKSDTEMVSEDIVETKKGAEAQFVFDDKNSISMNGSSEIQLLREESLLVQVFHGEIFGDTQEYSEAFEVEFGGNRAKLSEAVYSVSVQAGSQLLNIFSGDVSVKLSDGTTERVEKGEYLSVVNEEDGSITYTIADIQPGSLNQFLITQCQNNIHADVLCFSGEDLQAIVDAREAEKQAALEARLMSELVISEEAAAGEASSVEDNENTDNDVQEKEIPGQEEQMQEPAVREQSAAAPEEDKNICTITIRCDTILDNMENLDDGKEAYVPANGVILAASSVEFKEGQTVFDVLKLVCDYAGIQLEYSWTPLYNSYYIEGINHLYEFDCGNESGWMYKVNGWFPNYGCSGYELEDGDNIVWTYTCNGLGADVGGTMNG